MKTYFDVLPKIADDTVLVDLLRASAKPDDLEGVEKRVNAIKNTTLREEAWRILMRPPAMGISRSY